MRILTKQQTSTKTTSITTIILSKIIFLLITLPSQTSSQNCQRFCGKIPLKYPFGSGPGCGHPRFQRYITCSNSNQSLTFNTHKGSYPITSIDYPNQIVYISDPSMSTCSSTNQLSNGFGLDWDAPFSFHDDTIFALLDCSLENSPIFSPNQLNSIYSEKNLNFSASSEVVAPLCDKQGLPICSYLYSCQAIRSSVDHKPTTTCCVYTPVDLGPAFDMNLEELKCRSYSGFYSFNGRQSDPDNWKYGIALKYKLSVYNEFPKYCADCEKSFGVCGYTGIYNSFICNCPTGLNSSSDCLFGYNTSYGWKLLPSKSRDYLVMLGCYTALLFWFF